MRQNYNLKIIGDKVILVPYRKEHVEAYHEWMVNRTDDLDSTVLILCTLQWLSTLDGMQKDPELLETTASLPLTIEVRS